MTGGRWRVHLLKCLIPRWTRRWCWRLKSETEPLLGVTPHPLCPYCSSLFCFWRCPRTITSYSRLTSHPVCVWPTVFDYREQPDGAQRTAGRRGIRENDGGEGTRRRADFIGRKRDTKRQSAKRGERMGKMSLGKRLGIKTQGNWETKSKPGINGEEDKGGMKVERGKKD